MSAGDDLWSEVGRAATRYMEIRIRDMQPANVEPEEAADMWVGFMKAAAKGMAELLPEPDDSPECEACGEAAVYEVDETGLGGSVRYYCRQHAPSGPGLSHYCAICQQAFEVSQALREPKCPECKAPLIPGEPS